MDFLSKLQAIDFSNYNSEGVLSNGDWTLEYRYNMNASIDYIESIQLIVVIKYKGAIAETWGCMKDDQQNIVKYIMQAKEEASVKRYNHEEEMKYDAKKMYKAIK